MNIQTENRASLCDNLLHTYLLNESSYFFLKKVDKLGRLFW